MKVYDIVIKVVLALVAVGAAIFVVVAYGDKICAWFRKTFGCKCCQEPEVLEETPVEEPAGEPVEEPAEEPTPEVEEEVAPVEEGEVTASDADFEG